MELQVYDGNWRKSLVLSEIELQHKKGRCEAASVMQAFDIPIILLVAGEGFEPPTLGL